MFSKKTWVLIISCIISVSVVGWVVWHSRGDFLKIWNEVNIWYLVLACMSSAAIYACMGLSLWETLKLLGTRINIGAAVSIAFVSTTVNYLVSSLGVSGFALRAHLLGKRKVPLGVSVMASIVITVLLYMVLIIIILLGTLLLLFTKGASPAQMVKNFAVVVGIAAAGAVITAFFVNNEFRYKAVRKGFLLVNKIIYKLFGRLIPKNNYSAFEKQFDNGIKTIHRNRRRLTLAIVYICCDWIFTILILYLAFLSVGVNIPIGVLIAGFALGMVTTLIPILPGGLGAMELAMASVFSQMGDIPWEAALMAA
ncbi:MAG: flippase-like domain-containing protein, partial [Elusimicrobiota bacterium]|nr:flippase-like domain-containing protein [Elusimicrobiota bacterium]